MIFSNKGHSLEFVWIFQATLEDCAHLHRCPGVRHFKTMNCHNPSFISLALVMLLYNCWNRLDIFLWGQKGETYFLFAQISHSHDTKDTWYIKFNLGWLVSMFCSCKVLKALLEKLNVVNWCSPEAWLHFPPYLYKHSGYWWVYVEYWLGMHIVCKEGIICRILYLLSHDL